ncbi:MAG: hypothetical protein PHT40_04515 [Patescibacteria group bacterium]|nr:hypothetical protein [Patescibacteria group bacterium]
MTAKSICQADGAQKKIIFFVCLFLAPFFALKIFYLPTLAIASIILAGAAVSPLMLPATLTYFKKEGLPTMLMLALNFALGAWLAAIMVLLLLIFQEWV